MMVLTEVYRQDNREHITMLEAVRCGMAIDIKIAASYFNTHCLRNVPPGFTDDGGRMVRWCAFSDIILHSRMPLDPTHVRLKLLHACNQWHSSWESTALIVAIINYAETLKVPTELHARNRPANLKNNRELDALHASEAEIMVFLGYDYVLPLGGSCWTCGQMGEGYCTCHECNRCIFCHRCVIGTTHTALEPLEYGARFADSRFTREYGRVWSRHLLGLKPTCV
jgi:hypothetical protein